MKEYTVKLKEKVIGMTYLESADPPMGVVIGKVLFTKELSAFELIYNFCKVNGIVINQIDDEQKFIDTQTIDELKVYRFDGVEIKGVAGNSIVGMQSEGYEISILGIPYPFYEEEFPNHVKNYKT